MVWIFLKYSVYGNRPLVSGLVATVATYMLDYQMWSNSNDTTAHPGMALGKNLANDNKL